MRSQIFILLIIQSLLLAGLNPAFAQHKDEKAIKVTVDGRGDAFFHHPKTGQEVHLKYPSRAEIMAASPKNLQRQLLDGTIKTLNVSKKVADKAVNNPLVRPAVDTVKNFPMHAIPFYAAMFSIAVVQVHIGMGHDPMAIARFWESMADLPGHVGFGAFIYANQQVGALLGAMFADNRFKNYVNSYKKLKTIKDPAQRRRLMNKLRKQQAFFKPIKNRWEPVRKRVSKPVLFAGQYLGMAVGSLVSGIVTDFLHDPNVKICAANITRMSETEECEKAYIRWTAHDHWWNFAPHATSVVAAAVASLSTHKVASIAVRTTFGISIAGLSKVVPKIGLMALRFSQIGWAVQMGHMFINAANFLVWSHFLEYPARRFHFQKFVSNNTTGPALDRVKKQIGYLDKKQWSESAIEEALSGQHIAVRTGGRGGGDLQTFPLEKDLDHYKKQIKRYREQYIMYKTEATFTQWQDYLTKYETVRDFSEDFYEMYISEIFKLNNNPEDSNLFLNQDHSLSGIAPRMLFQSPTLSSAAESDIYRSVMEILTTKPKDQANQEIFEMSQRVTVRSFADILEGQIYMIWLSASDGGKRHSQFIIDRAFKMIEMLRSDSPEIMGQGIKEFYEVFAIVTNSHPDHQLTAHSREVAFQLIEAFDDIHSFWSQDENHQPYPRSPEEALSVAAEKITAVNMMVDLYGGSQENVDKAMKDLKSQRIKTSSALPTFGIGEAMLVAMVCGPDPEKNEPVIYTKKGWRAQFMPPKIVEGNTKELCSQNPLAGRWNQMTPFDDVKENIHQWEFDFKGKAYKGLGALIIDNIKPSVLGEKGTHYTGYEAGWRQKYIFDADDRAREGFQKKYEKEIRKTLIPAIMDESYSNDGKIANGISNSLADEVRVWAQMTSGLYRKAVDSKKVGFDGSESLIVGPEKMDEALKSTEKDIRVLMRALTHYSRKGELTNEFFVLAQKSLIALQSTLDSTPAMMWSSFYPLFSQLNYETPSEKGISDKTNALIDQAYGEIDDFLNARIPENKLEFTYLNGLYSRYNQLLAKAFRERKDLEAALRIEKRLAPGNKLFLLEKVMGKLQPEQKKLYKKSVINILDLVTEAYLKYQLVYNIYSSLPSLSEQKLEVEPKRSRGGKL